jgi:uncharacterized protein DUF4136
MKRRAFLVILAISAGVACSTVTSFDYDKTLDFSRFKTFGFAKGTPAHRESTQKRIEGALTSTLWSKGLLPAREQTPDLLVYTHVVLERQQRIDTTACGYGWNWGTGVTTTVVKDVPEGALVVDLVDSENKMLVWRGKAMDTIDRDSEATDDQLQRAVKGMFQGFPPAAKGSTSER